MSTISEVQESTVLLHRFPTLVPFALPQIIV